MLTGVSGRHAITFSLMHGVPAAMAEDLLRHAAVNPRMAAMRAAGPMVLCADDDGLVGREMMRDPYYVEVLGKHGHGYYAGTLLDCGRATEVAFSVLRRRENGPFAAGGLDFLRQVIPHLQRAVTLSWTLERLSRRAALKGKVLNRMKPGVIATCIEGEITMTNEAADRILRAEDGLERAGSRLRAQRPPDDAKLQHLLAAARNGTAEPGARLGATLLIGRPSGLQPYPVSVFPWSPPHPVFGARAKVVVFIRDMAAAAMPSEDEIGQLLGLTPAESRLAKRLLDGERLPSAAMRLGISQNTARTQLRSIFDKTDTRRQVDLIRLMTLMFGMQSA